MHSASTTEASLPDKVTIPCSRFSTLTCSLGERNIVEPAGWARATSATFPGRTVHILVSGSLPLVDQLERHFGGHHLGHRRGGMRMSAFLSKQHRARRQVDQKASCAGVSD
jgi:hypothetical protein